ncbi:DNA (cytosine-5-)-methyltransferase [Absicoccus porci]|uniref:DNA (cytosine-5-)-methyltransferase n=1 Tax=Absicoccus porci TaxID=2486576 RepID=A0A3N0HYK2_9FIRM|nr:DNA (cytosine-5-)-methyltransferase [Absicoccus porci]RNM29416.1 DNA (cytosine-5-)-methyltransferase [Absicoccus porci]
MDKTIVELFAGVGGFRLGFDKLNSGWKTVWFSQWEPGKKTQWAHDCYVSHYGDEKDLNGELTTGIDIASVDKNAIPDHTLLVGGFPCQDYSVAHSLKGEKGIEGKKGVLWWQIRDTIIAKQPPFCLFENVDRLLKSPAKQRGRDFGMILACLNNLDYDVEWRVINAAQYGCAQRRRRTFIFAYKRNTKYFKNQKNRSVDSILDSEGFFAKGFPVDTIDKRMIKTTKIPEDLLEVSDNFRFLFENSGYLHDGELHTLKVQEIEEKPIVLRDILQSNVDEEYYLSTDQLKDWTYMKGSKRIERVAANGHKYVYSEGPVGFPDAYDKPGRTMLTSEGTKNRSTHVVADPWTGRLRILTPIEAERLQGFDDDWTNTGMTNRQRYFCMGNALVVPLITRMGKQIDNLIKEE